MHYFPIKFVEWGIYMYIICFCIFPYLSTCVSEVKISFSFIFCVGYIFRTGDVRALMYSGASSLYNSLTSLAQLASESALDKSQKGLTFRFCDVHLLQSKGQISFLKGE